MSDAWNFTTADGLVARQSSSYSPLAYVASVAVVCLPTMALSNTSTVFSAALA